MHAINRDIFALAQANRCFRREILTNEHTQIVLMSIDPGDDIGEEVHQVDQILVFVSGSGEALLGADRSSIKAQMLVAVPAGTPTQLLQHRPNAAQALHGLLAAGRSAGNAASDQGRG